MLNKQILVFVISIILFTNPILSQPVTVYLTTSGGSLSTEKWTNITTGINGTGTVIWQQGGGTIGTGAGLLSDEAIVISCGTTYYLNTFDRYDDSWDGTTYTLRDATGGGGTLIINNSGASPDDGSDADATAIWGVGEYTVDLESSESFSVVCPCSPDIGTALAIVTNCASGTFDVSLLITAATSGATVTISDGGTNPNQTISSFPSTVIFTGYTSGSSVTLNADNGTCNINSKTVTENCTFGYSCALAQPITNGYTTPSSIITPGSGGIEEWVTTANASCGTASDNGFEQSDVHLFSYTTGTVVGESFYFTIDHNSSVNGEHSIGLWSNCTNGVLSGCIESTYKFDDIVGICAQNLAANTTYYIGVGKEWYSLDGTNLDFDVIDFTVETSTSIPDDECATAVAMDVSQPYSGSTRCSYTASAGTPSGCGSIENDSWVSFTADSTTAIIDYDVSNCTNGNGVQLSVWSGSCGSLSMVTGSCLNYAGNNSSGTWTFSGLTIGDTYYVRADGYAGDLCSYSYTPIGGIVVLPITLVNFSGVALKNGHNRINWTTSSEINNDYFELEKSENGIDFELVTTQNGAGNSTSTLRYFDYDKSEKEITYYRLKQVDFDGRFSYSVIISVTNSAKEFKIYPNPSSDGHLFITNIKNDNLVRIIDPHGRVLESYRNIDMDVLNLDLSDYNKGLYYIMITTNSEVFTEKVLIQ
tara:strand:- start:890 stop:2998 length:2109 start_codon:yes stop_codon:yes gene_type:complete